MSDKDKKSELSKFIAELEGRITSLTEMALKDHSQIKEKQFQEFFKLCDEASYQVRNLNVEQKKTLYLKISECRIALLAGPEGRARIAEARARREPLQSLRDFQGARSRHTYKKAYFFLDKYIKLCQRSENLRKEGKALQIGDMREIMSTISREIDISRTYPSHNLSDNKTILDYYNEATASKCKDTKIEAFDQIKRFIDQKAFRLFVIFNEVGWNNVYFNKDELPAAKEKQLKIKNMIDNGKTLSSQNDYAFSINFYRFYVEVFNNFTGTLCRSYEQSMSNPFDVIQNKWASTLSVMHDTGRHPRIFVRFKRNYIKEFEQRYQTDNNGGLVEVLHFRTNDNKTDSIPLQLVINNELIEKSGYPSKSRYYNDNPFNRTLFWEDLHNFDFQDTELFQKSALPIEKPSISPTPDHPEKGKPKVIPTPANPSQGKPEITAQGEKLQSSLKEQAKGKSSQKEEIEKIVTLPPTELPKEKTLTDGLLSYSFLSSLKGGRAFVAKQFPMVDSLVQRFMPQLSYVSNLSSNLLQKASIKPSAKKIMRGATAKKPATSLQSSGNSKTATGKKAGMSVKGHFITYAVFIGLETLHAKLINSGYNKAASFVPVTSNWRPWGNAFFANFDRNLQINPEVGTTRLFNHVADGVAYLAEGASNIINYVGNAEASFHSNLLDEKVTGFDARFFGLINGATEVGYRVVDTLGGSLDKRREKALDKFYANHPNEKETMEEKTSRLKNSILAKRQSKSWVEPNNLGAKTTKLSTPKTSSKMKDIDVKDLETSKTNPTKAKPSQLIYKASLYNKAPNMMGKVEAKANLFDRKSQKTWTTSSKTNLSVRTRISSKSYRPGNGRLGVIPQD